MADNEELVKSIESLTKSVKSIQDDLLMLKRGTTHSGLNPQSPSGTQQSDGNDMAGDNLPPGKKPRIEEEEEDPATESEEGEDTQVPLLTLSDAASAFLETTLRVQAGQQGKGS